MDFHITGCADFVCKNCQGAYSYDAEKLNFCTDPNADTGVDEYSKYLSELKTYCKNCASELSISFDVWEHPAGIVNYVAYSERGIKSLSYEFDIVYFVESEE